MNKFDSDYIFSDDTISNYYRGLLGIEKNVNINFKTFVKKMKQFIPASNLIRVSTELTELTGLSNCKHITFQNNMEELYHSYIFRRIPLTASIILASKNMRIYALIFDKEKNTIFINPNSIGHESFIKIHKKVLQFFLEIKNSEHLKMVKNEVSRIKYEHKKMTVTVGIDGELELVNNGEIYRASKYIDDYESNKKIGVDGSGDPMELRPTPSVSAAYLANNVSKLINSFKYGMSAKGDSFPIGCHIHLSIKENKNFDNDFSRTRKIIYKKVSKTTYLTKLLDFYLGKHIICLNGRTRGRYYGRLSDIRTQFHGGIEYRTPPSAIMADKEFFTVVISIAKAVFSKYINGGTFGGYTRVCNGIASKEDYIELGINNIDTFFEKIEYYKNNRNVLFNINAAWTTEERNGNS